MKFQSPSGQGPLPPPFLCPWLQFIFHSRLTLIQTFPMFIFHGIRAKTRFAVRAQRQCDIHSRTGKTSFLRFELPCCASSAFVLWNEHETFLISTFCHTSWHTLSRNANLLFIEFCLLFIWSGVLTSVCFHLCLLTLRSETSSGPIERNVQLLCTVWWQ